jgi:hypothetical protein
MVNKRFKEAWERLSEQGTCDAGLTPPGRVGQGERTTTFAAVGAGDRNRGIGTTGD